MHVSYLGTLFTLSISASSIPTPPNLPKSYYLPKRLIALEEHVVSPSLEAEVIASGIVQRSAPGTLEKLKDVGAGRIAAMDAGHLSLQVLSQQSASGSDDPEGCRKANDAVRSAIDSNPTRFAGFAVLPMSSPIEAAAELNRSITHLGFKGAMLWNHLKDGTYYDDPLAKLLFAGTYDAATAGRLGTNSWGWHVDVGTHVLRLYSAGVFVRFPHLKVILGHNGEDLPMFIDRVDSTGLRNSTTTKTTTFAHVWRTNVWITTSAFFSVSGYVQVRAVTGMERVMYSVDYPFSSLEDGWGFMERLAESGIGREEMDGFAFGNAERLLGI
ncbi:hypothetical protein GQ44DRAFT_748359 [Phaeosphaeriaceae sp. PMI808]|nr:hypothetical protein GQ44DRAFT_748359 [Phaeosphaeriaceae sp. PMI808]